MPLILTDAEKAKVLTEVQDQLRKESIFWRDRSWNVTVKVVSLVVALSTAASFLNVQYPVVPVFFFTLASIATVYLLKTFDRYKGNRERLAKVEEALGFFDNNMYLPNKPLYPARFHKVYVTFWGGSGIFILSIWIVTVFGALAMNHQNPDTSKPSREQLSGHSWDARLDSKAR